MAIWHPNSSLDLDRINNRSERTLVASLGIRITEIGDDYLRGTMPVNELTMQPYRVLHGGASVALAETLGSTGTALCLDPHKHAALGMEINANHVRPAAAGLVTGTARPVHLGRRTQVWEIHIENDAGKLVCISRFTGTSVPVDSVRMPPGEFLK
jgi:1,4-dihydroxy-2-naphthoyl-CoA hydrolase